MLASRAECEEQLHTLAPVSAAYQKNPTLDAVWSILRLEDARVFLLFDATCFEVALAFAFRVEGERQQKEIRKRQRADLNPCKQSPTDLLGHAVLAPTFKSSP